MLEKFSEYTEIRKSKIGHTKYCIVIPTYKRIESLKETLKSAMSQKGIINYGITVVDNNPERNDDTELYLSCISDFRLSYYKNCSNVGMVNNWNQCILAAECDWVVFVHDDDVLNENCLTNIDETIKKNSTADAILPNFIQVNNPFFKENSNYLKTKSGYFKNLIKHYCRNMPITANLFLDNIYGPPTCGLALKREAVLKFGGYPSRCIAADWDFMMHFSMEHNVIKCEKQTGVYLWSVNESLKDSTMEQIRKDRITIIQDIVEKSLISKFYFNLLRRDFEKKFNAKTTDYVDYSILYKIIRKYYSMRI